MLSRNSDANADPFGGVSADKIPRDEQTSALASREKYLPNSDSDNAEPHRPLVAIEEDHPRRGADRPQAWGRS